MLTVITLSSRCFCDRTVSPLAEISFDMSCFKLRGVTIALCAVAFQCLVPYDQNDPSKSISSRLFFMKAVVKSVVVEASKSAALIR